MTKTLVKIPNISQKSNVILILVIILTGINFYFIFREQRITASFVTQQELRRLIRLSVQRHETLVNHTREVLTLISKLPQVQGENIEECNRTLASLIEKESRFLVFGVLELNGDIFCSSSPFEEGANVAYRAYFQRVLKSGEFSAGEYQVGVVTKQQSINFGYPIRDNAGQIQRVALTAIGLEWLGEFSQEADLPTDSEFVLTDSEGMTLVRFPDGHLGVEAQETKYPIERLEYIEQGLGVLEIKKLNGEEYFLIAAPLKLAGQEGFLHIIISVPKKNVLRS